MSEPTPQVSGLADGGGPGTSSVTAGTGGPGTDSRTGGPGTGAPGTGTGTRTGTGTGDDGAAADGHTHVVHNGKRVLTIDELAATQPGMDRLMAELGPRMHRLCYAGRAGNWRLADYFFKSIVKQLRLCGFSRPKYDDDIAAYIAEDCEPVKAALKARDGAAFERAYQHMVDRANHYHVEWKKPYIIWKTPATPPDDLDLTAGLES